MYLTLIAPCCFSVRGLRNRGLKNVRPESASPPPAPLELSKNRIYIIVGINQMEVKKFKKNMIGLIKRKFLLHTLANKTKYQLITNYIGIRVKCE